jgi:hypothetical protein
MKKFISLFLVFSLLALSVNLYAKERRGAKLIITKKDGQQIEGELITVKPNSLLLLDTEGKDVSIDIADIKVITIVKKSKVGKGALYGLLIGGVIGALEGIREGKDAFIFSSSELAAMGALVFGLLGALLGAGIGAVAGTDKTIQIEGMTDSEIQAVMYKLRKKARIRDYK